MKMSEFQQLQDREQVAFLYDKGVYLGKRREERQIILLFQLESFYVELYYQVYRTFISKISISLNTTILEPYLEQIDVEDLVSEI
jgi:hypothetical protein